MKAQHRTLQGEDDYRTNLRLHFCLAPAKRIAVLAVLSEHGHYQGLDPFGVPALLVLAQIVASARTS